MWQISTTSITECTAKHFSKVITSVAGMSFIQLCLVITYSVNVKATNSFTHLTT